MKSSESTSRVSILLATFDGLPYLPQLLETVLKQTYTNFVVDIRDDGSNDNTYPFLVAWAEGHANTRLSQGRRLGPALSFFQLLENADPNCEYFAFCDQDDVWLPQKIENAVSALSRGQKANLPLLYCSRVEYVDAALRHLGYSTVPKHISFANALVENIATGCTIVMNQSARQLLLEAEPSGFTMHDAWCYIVISALGKVIYDPWVGVRYRQHDANVLGVSPQRSLRWSRRIRSFVRHWPSPAGYLAGALEVDKCLGAKLKEGDRQVLDNFLRANHGFVDRVRCVLRMSVTRQTRSDNAFLRALILMGRV